MKINRNIVGLLAVAGAAYAAGHFGVLSSGGSDAWAQPEREPSAEDLAYIKAGAPGEHHQVLDQMAGEWEGVFKIWMEPNEAPMMSSGTVSRKWILGGRFLKEVVTATSDMGTFEGVGFIGYDNFDGQYQSVWMDSMSTAIHTETGTYHPDKKVLHLAGDHRDPVTGRLAHSWGKMDLSSPDRHVYTANSTDPDGRTYKAFEGVMERRK
jgi:hypothetical protein